MGGMETFLKLFGDFPVIKLVEYIVVIGFLFKLWIQTKKYIATTHDAEQAKEQAMQKVLDDVAMLIRYKQIVMDYKETNNAEIRKLQATCADIIKAVENVEERRRLTERKALQSTLLQTYRLMTDPKKNPAQAWTEVESDAFWDSFTDYEDHGGNGHMHDYVQPAMRKLEVIKMADTEKLNALMHSRNF